MREDLHPAPAELAAVVGPGPLAPVAEAARLGRQQVEQGVTVGVTLPVHVAVVERLMAFKEALGLTGFSLDVNPGGQLPYERVVNSIHLLTEKVIPNFK